jgi:septal ring factor EnvC (AmiA/AmiB activator)
MTRRARTLAALGAALGAALLLASATAARAQDTTPQELRESQLRLERIKKEREELQREMATLRSRVSDVSSQLVNIERQVAASADVLKELEFQSAALTVSVDSTTRQLLRARDRLRERRVVLRHRLRSIYKRGPLHTARVLLGAESFADLLNRYKYLHLIALYDRTLVQEVGRLERELTVRERELSGGLAQLEYLREEKQGEFDQLRALESEQERTLRSFRQRAQQAEGRLAQLARDEARLTNLVAELERKRIEEERRRAVAGARPAPAGTITTRALGALDWPVDGELVYRFGPQRRPNGVVLRWNGIGIAAQAGSPVRAVEGGTVVMAGPFEGYGPTVMISHGAGYYTLYLYLQAINVREGQKIEPRQVVGTVGGEKTPEGAHIEFQVRAPTRSGGIPEPVDPLDWLRRRGGR